MRMYSCYLSLPETVSTGIKYCVNTEQDNIVSMVKKKKKKTFFPKYIPIPASVSTLKALVHTFLHAEDKPAAVSCQNVPCIPHSST